MKRILCLFLAVLMAFVLFACAAKDNSGTSDTQTSPSDSQNSDQADTDDLSYILDKGTLVIGITPYEPMNYEDDNGELVGFDTEFAEVLCEKLGVTPEFKWIEWSTKEIELKARNIDCIWNGLTVDEERKENMAFTISYLRNEQAVVIRKADESKYTSLDSLAGASLAAEDGSAGEAAIENDLPDANYKAVDTQAKALLEVKAGTADAAVIDYTMARTMTGEGTDYSDLMLVTSIKMMPEEYAIGLRLDSSAVSWFNEIILELRDDGTLAALAEKYEVSDLLITN